MVDELKWNLNVWRRFGVGLAVIRQLIAAILIDLPLVPRKLASGSRLAWGGRSRSVSRAFVFINIFIFEIYFVVILC